MYEILISNLAGLGYLNDLWSFNVSSKRWSLLFGKDLNIAGNYAGAQSQPGSRISMAAAFDPTNRAVYIFGGFGLSSIAPTYLSPRIGVMNDLWLFNLTSGSWRFLGGGQLQENPGSIISGGTPFPSARRDSRLVFDDRQRSLHLIGGFGYGWSQPESAGYDTTFVTGAVDLVGLSWDCWSFPGPCGDISYAFDYDDGTVWNPGYTSVYRVSVTLDANSPLPIRRIRLFPSGNGVHSPTSINIWSDSSKTLLIWGYNGAITSDTYAPLSAPYFGRTFYIEIGKITQWQVNIYEINFLSAKFKGRTIILSLRGKCNHSYRSAIRLVEI